MSNCAIYSDILSQSDFRHVDNSKLQYFNWPNIDKFLSCDAMHKIVVVEFDYSNSKRIETFLDQVQQCDQVFVHSMEFTTNVINTMLKYDYSNFNFVINGFANFEMQQAKIIQTWPWFYCTSTPYLEKITHLLDNLRPFADKPMVFDVLLGKPKPHREFASNWIKNSKLESKYFQPPFFNPVPSHGPFEDYHVSNQNYWEDGIILNSPGSYLCTYQGIQMDLAQVLPIKIYNQTAYSLVCETEYCNDYTFFTEKTAKPIIACRLFVIIAGQYYLRNLKKIGFRTFDSVIDESYDLEPDPETRWRMAMEQCDWLCKQDQCVILKKIMPTVLHNFNLLGRLDTSVLDNQVQLFLIQNGYCKK